VTGDPGVGKTTFVDLFVQSAGLLPDLWIARGQCVEGFGGQEAYYPIDCFARGCTPLTSQMRESNLTARRRLP